VVRFIRFLLCHPIRGYRAARVCWTLARRGDLWGLLDNEEDTRRFLMDPTNTDAEELRVILKRKQLLENGD